MATESSEPAVWIIRQIAVLMQMSCGGLDHHTILNLTWRQFGVYLDSFTWLEMQKTKEGQMESKKKDLETMTRDPRVKEAKQTMLKAIKERVKKHLRPNKVNTATDIEGKNMLN